MFCLFLSVSACAAQFSLKQILWPLYANDNGLFGRAVSFSAGRVIVGASMLQVPGRIQHNNNQTGAVYPYTYSADDDSYHPSPGTSPGTYRIDPSIRDEIKPGTFGSKVQISVDGTAVIVGAPYTDVLTSYRDFRIDDSFDPTVDLVNYTNSDGISRSYFSELGAIYIFKSQGTQLWEEQQISVPPTVVFRGGYGRSLAGTESLQTFAGAYYNKIRPGSTIPQKVGKVFVESIGGRQDPVIDPPPPINNRSSQRFGSVMSFSDDKTLFVVAQATAGSVSAVYIYNRENDGGPWQLTGNVTVSGSAEFQNFGQCAAVRGRSLAAIYGSDAATHRSQIVIMRQDSAGIWNPSPAQVIDLASYEVGDTGITFCQSPEANYLAAAIGNSPAVIIFTENQKTGKFEFFQKVVDPQISEDGVTIPYSEQHVRFASDFAWEVGKCNRFAIGAMSMFDGPDGAPLPYGRVYVFTLTGQPPAEGSGNVLTIVLGVIGGAVVLIVIVFAVVYFRKRKLFARDAASEKLLMGGELSTTTE